MQIKGKKAKGKEDRWVYVSLSPPKPEFGPPLNRMNNVCEYLM